MEADTIVSKGKFNKSNEFILPHCFLSGLLLREKEISAGNDVLITVVIAISHKC